MLKHILIFAAYLSLIWSTPVMATDKVKFGEVSMEEISMKEYEKDPGAEAVILYDKGYSRIINYRSNFGQTYEFHKRIKIFNKSAFKWASVKVNLHRSESIKKIEAYTYNLVNGKIEKIPLSKESIFDEKVTNYWKTKIFTFPNVKEGSIIEFKYTISSESSISTRDWAFQSTIPTLYSEYTTRYPDNFDFNKHQQGHEPIHQMPKEKVTEILGKAAGDIVYIWYAQDVPALREEAHVSTIDNYVTKIMFDLASFTYPGRTLEIADSWKTVSKKLLENENFGEQFLTTGFFRKELKAIKSKHNDSLSQATAIYDFVKERMKWNELNRVYCNTTLREAYKKQEGNTADINLLLITMLRKAGFQADPVILSTRDNGKVYSFFVENNKINYVIARLILNNKEYLLDATEKQGIMGMLPLRCLNGEGLVLTKNGNKWIPLATEHKLSNLNYVQINIDSGGFFSGKIKVTSKDYDAFIKRKQITEEGEETFKKDFKNKAHKWDITNLQIENITNLNEILSQSYDIRSTESALQGSMLYIDPVFLDRETENPFKLVDRKYPVEFEAPIEKTYVCTIAIPNDYQIEDLPKPLTLEIPEKGGRFIFSVTANGNVINITSRLQIAKMMFYVHEYPALKEFYERVVAKHTEKIVLKKK